MLYPEAKAQLRNVYCYYLRHSRELTRVCSPRVTDLARTDIRTWRAPSPGLNRAARGDLNRNSSIFFGCTPSAWMMLITPLTATCGLKRSLSDVGVSLGRFFRSFSSRQTFMSRIG